MPQKPKRKLLLHILHPSYFTLNYIISHNFGFAYRNLEKNQKKGKISPDRKKAKNFYIPIFVQIGDVPVFATFLSNRSQRKSCKNRHVPK